MKEKFTELLKHPLWSKVFATFIVLGVTAGFNLFIAIWKSTNFKTEFYNFWNFDVKLWIVFSAFLLSYLIFKLLNNKRRTKFNYDNDTLNLDRKLFERIRTKIINETVVINLKGNSFSSHPFDMDDIDFVHQILEDDKNPNFEFINPILESLKNSLIISIDKLQDALGNNIFGTDIQHPTKHFISIPKEWKGEQLNEAKKEVENAENIVYANYENLIKTGRRILKI